jgi:hypothetical protein
VEEAENVILVFTMVKVHDAAGGMRFYPRFKTMEKGEAQRHELLKTKLTFAVVHGVGTFIYQSFPDLGCQGCNLTLEVCFRGVSLLMYLDFHSRSNCYCFSVALKEAMKIKKIQVLKKLNIQLDNANNNKGWTVIIGLSVLVALGICDKIVVAFLLVGHTHTDVDRIISYVITYLRGMDIPTLESVKQYALKSFKSKVNARFNMELV